MSAPPVVIASDMLRSMITESVVNAVASEGIAYAYETGRLASSVLIDALASGDGLALQRYETEIQAQYGLYYKVARAFVKIIGRPELMRALVSTGMHSRTLMEWVLRIMANLLRDDELLITREFDAPVALVFRLWESRDHMLRWWGPEKSPGRCAPVRSESIPVHFRTAPECSSALPGWSGWR